MAGWLERLTSSKGKSANNAKERLKLVLIHDRSNISPTAMEQMKNELIGVISRYVEIDPAAVNIEMQQEGREQRLIADIPLKVATRRRAG